MNLHERVLSVLGCRFVDDVLIDAPVTITPQMIQLLKIDEVIAGTRGDDFGEIVNNDRYSFVINAGIFTELPSPKKFTISNIVDRIQANQKVFQAKITKKKKAEVEYYEDKYSNHTSSSEME